MRVLVSVVVRLSGIPSKLLVWYLTWMLWLSLLLSVGSVLFSCVNLMVVVVVNVNVVVVSVADGN